MSHESHDVTPSVVTDNKPVKTRRINKQKVIDIALVAVIAGAVIQFVVDKKNQD